MVRAVRYACCPWAESTMACPSREQPDVIFAAFGDMMRVPGTNGSPLEHKARGMDVRIVYSPSDALKLARANPGKHVMFFAIGFETTAPSTALTLMRAKAEGIRNFSVFCNHVTIIPAIRAILDSPGYAPGRLHRSRPRIDRHRLPPVRVDREGRSTSRSSFQDSSRSIFCSRS